MKVTFFVSGLTVNRKSPDTGCVTAETVLEPPLIRVPPFAFGEFSGRSCVVAILYVDGPFR
jgi:hypothetical protein